jgi:predicted nucleic acid-binding protein
MPPTKPGKLRVFVDADVLIAGAASPSEHSASLVILRMAELTLLEAITSRQVIGECERNIQTKIPRALPAFQMIVHRCLQVVADPDPSELEAYQDRAHPKDLPLLVTAAQAGCAWLVTFNLLDYQPGISSVTVLEPGDLLIRIRSLLADMNSEDI